MTAFCVGDVVRFLMPSSMPSPAAIVLGYRAEDDTIVVSDVDGVALSRWSADSPGMIRAHVWDSDTAIAYRTELRRNLFGHLEGPGERVAVVIAQQLDLEGRVVPL